MFTEDDIYFKTNMLEISQTDLYNAGKTGMCQKISVYYYYLLFHLIYLYFSKKVKFL